MKKTKHIFLVIIFLTICSIVFILNSAQKPLSETEILDLRDQYPIYGIRIPETISMQEVTLEEYIQYDSLDSFVYGEVVGELSTFGKNISTGYSELDEKINKYVVNPSHDFYEYTISVIKDTEGRYKKGEQITIAANILFINYNPTLSDGMKVVVPVLEDEPSINREWFHVIGMYYVTEDDYVISAYDEDKFLTRNNMSGMKVDDLLKELAKMIE